MDKHSVTSAAAESNSLRQTIEFGPPLTLRYRMLFLDKQFRPLSPWHNIPLYAGESYVNFLCTTPKGTWARFEVAEKEDFNPLRLVKRLKAGAHFSKNCEWNMGLLPQTWGDPEQVSAEFGGLPFNGAPVEVVEIGNRQANRGEVYPVKPLGAFAVIDKQSNVSWKIVAVAAMDWLANILFDVDDVVRVRPNLLDDISEWLRTCECIGSDDKEKSIGLDKRAGGCTTTVQVIAEAHAAWQLHHDSLKLPEPWLPQAKMIKATSLEGMWYRYTGAESTLRILLSQGKSEPARKQIGSKVEGDSSKSNKILSFLRSKPRAGRNRSSAVESTQAEERNAANKDAVKESGEMKGTEATPLNVTAVAELEVKEEAQSPCSVALSVDTEADDGAASPALSTVSSVQEKPPVEGQKGSEMGDAELDSVSMVPDGSVSQSQNSVGTPERQENREEKSLEEKASVVVQDVEVAPTAVVGVESIKEELRGFRSGRNYNIRLAEETAEMYDRKNFGGSGVLMPRSSYFDDVFTVAERSEVLEKLDANMEQGGRAQVREMRSRRLKFAGQVGEPAEVGQRTGLLRGEEASLQREAMSVGQLQGARMARAAQDRSAVEGDPEWVGNTVSSQRAASRRSQYGGEGRAPIARRPPRRADYNAEGHGHVSSVRQLKDDLPEGDQLADASAYAGRDPPSWYRQGDYFSTGMLKEEKPSGVIDNGIRKSYSTQNIMAPVDPPPPNQDDNWDWAEAANFTRSLSAKFIPNGGGKIASDADIAQPRLVSSMGIRRSHSLGVDDREMIMAVAAWHSQNNQESWEEGSHVARQESSGCESDFSDPENADEGARWHSREVGGDDAYIPLAEVLDDYGRQAGSPYTIDVPNGAADAQPLYRSSSKQRSSGRQSLGAKSRSRSTLSEDTFKPMVTNTDFADMSAYSAPKVALAEDSTSRGARKTGGTSRYRSAADLQWEEAVRTVSKSVGKPVSLRLSNEDKALLNPAEHRNVRFGTLRW